MSSAPEVFPFGSPSEPTFEVALRGYEKKQVDRYVQQVEAEVAALVAEREDLYGQIGLLNQHIQQLQQEVASSRRTSTPGEVSYRHLGARAEQILALAEEQAAEIRERVSRELAEREEVLNRTRAELDARAADAARNFENLLAKRRAEEEAEAAKRRAEVEAEVQEAKEYAGRVRSDVDALYAAALEESTRVGNATKAYADEV
ncbi:MAG TPA: DivIVA domain-containing protein, partial [Geminicoccaceae bacterium]|nr:DivIVA domain-containing protein [Geminicoccaceae bacterium]